MGSVTTAAGHLSLDPVAADYVVDLSSVVRDRGLCSDRPADLSRFTGLVDALVAHSRDRTVKLCAVADWSLLRLRELTEAERLVLGRWHRQGLIEVRGGTETDDRVLELADAAHLVVVSRDTYLDYFRRYPWLAGNRDRFLRPAPGPDGRGVAVMPRIMPVPHDVDISRKREEGLLLREQMYDRRGGTGARQDLLTRRWRCPEAECPLFGPQRSEPQPVPRYADGRVRCPAHRSLLEDVGPLPRRVQLKIRIGGTVLRRFVVEPGRELAVGREPEADGVSLASLLSGSAEHEGPRVSRQHLRLLWNGHRLRAVDTSRHGTTVRRSHRRPTPEEFPLPPGEPRRLHPGDVLVLAPGVELEVSGREFVFDDPDDGSSPYDPGEHHGATRRFQGETLDPRVAGGADA